MVRHQVEDYDKWKAVFDKGGSMRKEAGSAGYWILQAAGDPLNLTIFMEWDSHDNARTFAESPDLKEAMERAGITGPPEIAYFEEVEKGSD